MKLDDDPLVVEPRAYPEPHRAPRRWIRELFPVPPYTIRQMMIGDMNKILSDYVAHYRTMMSHVNAEVYSKGMQARFGRLALRNKMLVAANPCSDAIANKKDICGWLMYYKFTEAFVLHYIYVPREYRMQGVARALMETAGWREGMPIHASHKFRFKTPFQRRLKLIHNPFLLEAVAEWNLSA